MLAIRVHATSFLPSRRNSCGRGETIESVRIRSRSRRTKPEEEGLESLRVVRVFVGTMIAVFLSIDKVLGTNYSVEEWRRKKDTTTRRSRIDADHATYKKYNVLSKAIENLTVKQKREIFKLMRTGSDVTMHDFLPR